MHFRTTLGLGFALLALSACTIQQPQNTKQNAPTSTENGESGGTETGGERGETGETGEPGETGNPTSTSDPKAFADKHWWTPACKSVDDSVICYDVKFNSDGTYQRQHIIKKSGSSSAGTLYCEHGSWKVSSGQIELTTCKGDTYEQSWSHASGAFTLQGIKLEEDSHGIFNCSFTTC